MAAKRLAALVTITLTRAMAYRLRHACREAEYAATHRTFDTRPHPYRAADRAAAIQYRRLGAIVCAAVEGDRP
jgi:hypothetical protein